MKHKTTWRNDDLQEYYANMPIEELRDFTKLGGFDNCCDVELIRSYINKADSILEVGAGYGRVIENILAHGFTGKLSAIERCENFYGYMKEHLSNDKLNLILGDIKYYKFSERFDLILLMWSNLSEYPASAQASFLRYLHSLLTSQGRLVIETIDHQIAPKNSTNYTNQTYVVNSNHGTAYGYIASADEIRNYVKQIGGIVIEQISYVTTTQRQRMIFVIA